MSTADSDSPVAPEPHRPLARARRIAESKPEPRRPEPAGAKPPAEIPPPPGVTLFRSFCALAAAASAIGAGASFILLSNNFFDYDESDGKWEFAGTLASALALFTAFAIPLVFAKPRPWVWYYGLVLLSLVSVSVYFTIFGVPLLIFWAQTSSRNYFRQIRPAQRRGRERYGEFDEDEEYEPLPREPRRSRRPGVQLD